MGVTYHHLTITSDCSNFSPPPLSPPPPPPPPPSPPPPPPPPLSPPPPPLLPSPSPSPPLPCPPCRNNLVTEEQVSYLALCPALRSLTLDGNPVCRHMAQDEVGGGVETCHACTYIHTRKLLLSMHIYIICMSVNMYCTVRYVCATCMYIQYVTIEC